MPNKDETFTLRLSHQERALIEKLSKAEHRSIARAIIWAAIKYAKSEYGIEINNPEE